MSVIVSRALPDVRDGLKPVQRRILWAMHDANLRPDRPFVKCARVVGDVMANYHPHGDSSIYDALVRMGQPFSLTAPLIDKHGNFGSPADPPAASRYTECRLSPLAMELLAGHRRRHRRHRAQLRRVAFATGRDALTFPEPAGERIAGDRGGDGHQHPAAQPGRGVQRRDQVDRQARVDARRPDADREGPRLPDRRVHHGRRRHQGRVPHRSRNDPRARPPRDRIGPAWRPGDRAHRGAVPNECRRHRGQARRAGRVGEDRRRSRHPQRVGAGQDPARDRASQRRQPADRAQQPVQAHRRAEHVPGEHGRPRRRRAPHDQSARSAPGVARSPGRGRHPALAVPPREGAGPAAHRRGFAQGARHDRRGGEGDPRFGRSQRRTRRADGEAVRLLRDPGQPHSRHGARPAHPPRPRGARQGSEGARRHGQGAEAHPRQP